MLYLKAQKSIFIQTGYQYKVPNGTNKIELLC